VNGTERDFIAKIADEHWSIDYYCKHCEQYGDCDMKKQKILSCNQMALAYAKDAMNGGVPFGELDIMKRPSAMNQLIVIAINEYNGLMSKHKGKK
jgi:hypothetical protein